MFIDKASKSLGRNFGGPSNTNFCGCTTFKLALIYSSKCWKLSANTSKCTRDHLCQLFILFVSRNLQSMCMFLCVILRVSMHIYKYDQGIGVHVRLKLSPATNRSTAFSSLSRI